MRAPVVEVADILGQDPLQMALIEYENVVQALGPDRSHPALGDGVGSRRSERCAYLGDTNITHPTIEGGAVAAVAVMNEKTWRLAVPAAAFDDLPCRPLDGPRRWNGRTYLAIVLAETLNPSRANSAWILR